MRRTFFKSKIHRATVTHADLDYEGSVSVDEDLLEAAGSAVLGQRRRRRTGSEPLTRG